MWALGPELPQRVPLGVVLGWVAAITGGPVAGKALIVLSVAASFVGASRLAAGAPTACRIGAGALYALSPWALTRIGSGHLNVHAAAAALPWCLPHLLRPRTSAHALLAGAALALAGPASAPIAGAAALVVLAAERSRRGVVAVVALLAPHAVWVVPAAVAAWSGVELSGAEAFATRTPVLGLPLLAGGGFWRAPSEVVPDGVLAIGGPILTALAVLGHRDLPAAWRSRAAAVAAMGVVLSLTGSVRALLGDGVLAAPLRDSHRALALFLVWAAPAAALGTARVARAAGPRLAPVALVAAPALAIAMAGPGLWGIEGRLDPVELPAGWAALADRLEGEPGTVLALPWHGYLDLGFADGRRVLNPLARYLDRDVLTSFDPELGPAHQEQVDPRAAGVEELVLEVQRGRPVADELARRGVRWVVLLHEADADTYRGLVDDPGLRAVSDDPALSLYEVRGWRGEVVDDGGRPLEARRAIRPVLRPDDEVAATWSRPAQPGWLRGFDAAGPGIGGRLRTPEGSGPVWFWPAAVAGAVDLAVLFAVVLAVRLVRTVRP
jgi:hypothetical protein